MRKIILAATAGAFGLLAVSAPAFAISSYQIQGDQAANFQDPDTNTDNLGGLNITSKSTTTDSSGFSYDNGPVNNLTGQPTQSQNLSRDMSWQGTGYYLRPSN